jgi:2C-methyl-D-erythritol 2,4-cyclodiphosphate synthase
MSIHEYFDNIARSLMAFQYLEGMLKFYIRDCDRIVQKSVKDSFHYSVREKDIEKMPLGRLIEEFSIRSNRKDIISVLKKLNKHRNYIAHTAYILTIEKQKDSEKMQELADRIAKVTEIVRACMKVLAHEHSRVTNEPISKEIIDSI